MNFRKQIFPPIAFLIICLVLILGVIGLLSLKKSPGISSTDDKLKVITTLFPLYDFAKNIGQENVEVTLLLPPGIEPHAFEPKPSDVVMINSADVFIYTSPFMEVWAEDIIKGILNQSLVIVDSSNSIPTLSTPSQSKKSSDETTDPHIWLDFANAQAIVDNITAGLIAKDPANKNFYLANASVYKQKLSSEDLKYSTTLKKCRTREIIYGGHYAFGYLAKKYDLDYQAVSGFSPDAEPTANDLITLVKQIQKDKIKYLFYEELTSPKIAQTLANETGTKMLMLNAAHNLSKDDLRAGVSYLSIMDANLANLKLGLGCN